MGSVAREWLMSSAAEPSEYTEKKEADVNRFIVGLSVCVGLAAGASIVALAAGKPVANPRVTVGFSSQAGDGMKGDVSGNYVGGVSGVVAELQVNKNAPAFLGFSNLLVNITSTGKARRYFLLNYPQAAATDCSDGAGAPTASNVKVAGYFNIHSIGAIAVGEVRAVRAYIGSPDGEFGWIGESSAKCSTTVAVYRPSWNTWNISSDVTRLGLTTYSVPGIDKNDDGSPNCQTDGNGRAVSCSIMSYRGVDDWAIQNGGTSWQTPSALNQLGFTTGFLGNYSMPFAITVITMDPRLNGNRAACGLEFGCSFPY